MVKPSPNQGICYEPKQKTHTPTLAYENIPREGISRCSIAVGVGVVIGSDQPQTLSELSPRKSLVINFSKPERAAEEILAFARIHPIDAVVGVDDDTTNFGVNGIKGIVATA